MTRRPRKTQFDQDELLIDMPERNQGLDWPFAMDLWLDRMVEQARHAGVTTTRKELSAALASQHDPGDEQLVALLRRYRQRTGRDLLGSPDDAPNVMTFERHGPGQRRRAGS